MKKLCLFIFAVFITFKLFAQLEKGYIYLKNGTVLKGKYQFSDEDKLKVVSSGNIWVFDSEDVDSVTNRRIKNRASIDNGWMHPALFFPCEIGVLAGNSENSQPAPFSFTSSINYAIVPEFSAGIGIGAEFLKETYMPAFVNLEYRFRNSSGYFLPYFFLIAGYQVPLEESRSMYYSYNPYPAWSSVWPGPVQSDEPLDAKGGFLINPGIGYTQLFSSGFGMSVAFGYRFTRLNYSGENDYELDIDYNRLSVKLGIIF